MAKLFYYGGISKMNFIRALVRPIWHFLFRWHCYPILVPIFLKAIQVRTQEGKCVPWKNYTKNYQLSILALHPEKFNGDPRFLAKHSDFRVLELPVLWLSRLINAFYLPSASDMDYYNSENSVFLECKEKCRKFLHGLLSRLYKKIKIDCVITANIRYKTELDWVYVSQKIGTPYILLYREGLLHTYFKYQVSLHRHQRFAPFFGTHIIVHNEVTKRVYVNSQCARPTQITVSGVLRMDGYISKIKAHKRRDDKKRVVFFYFNPNEPAIGEKGFLLLKLRNRDPSLDQLPPVFINTLRSLIKLALENPEIEFIIKPKFKDFQNKRVKIFNTLCNEFSVKPENIPNLIVSTNISAQDWILDSSVVCGLHSTTLLEAGIAQKPIVIPYYQELINSKYLRYFGFRNHMDLFDIAKSPFDFEKMIMHRLEDSRISDEIIKKRETFFEEYVSFMDADALGRYVKTIKTVCANFRKEDNYGHHDIQAIEKELSTA